MVCMYGVYVWCVWCVCMVCIVYMYGVYGVYKTPHWELEGKGPYTPDTSSVDIFALCLQTALGT